MRLRLIKTEQQYQAALRRIEQLMDARAGTMRGEELELLAALVEMYESERFPIGLPDPVAAIQFRVEQAGLTSGDLAQYLGGRNRVSEILNRKRPLTLGMIRNLHEGLGIPLASLVGASSWQIEGRRLARAG